MSEYTEKLKKKLQTRVNEDKDSLTKLCSEMVKIPSENPPGDMSEMAYFIRNLLENHGIPVESYEPAKGKINLVAKIGEGRPSLILNGHMDVVPAGDTTRWDFPPFSGEIKEGKIFGRGATDMKGGLSSIISAFILVFDTFESLSGTVTLAIVPDEETGAEYGARWLTENRKVQGDACLIGGAPMNGCLIGEKGLCQLRLKSTGTPAHGSLPMLGDNAIEKLADMFSIIHSIERQEIEVPNELSKVIKISKDFYKEIMKARDITDESKLDAIARCLDHNTVNIGLIRGGSKINIVPESCVAEVDIRTPAGISPHEIKREIEDLLKEANGGDIECELLSDSEANYTPTTERIYMLLNQNAKKIIGTELRPILVSGATDARFFRLHGTPTIDYGPGDLLLCHAINEYVSIENIVKTTKVIVGTIIDFVCL